MKARTFVLVLCLVSISYGRGMETITHDGLDGFEAGRHFLQSDINTIDISDDTNLAATAPIILTGDTLSLDYEATDLNLVGTTLTITDSGIDHDATTNFLDVEHINWTDATVALKTTNSGRFDGGIGVGFAPVADQVRVDYLFAKSGIYASNLAAPTANYLTLIDNFPTPGCFFAPNTDDYFDLGRGNAEWKDLYVDGLAYIDALGHGLDCGGFALSNVGTIDGLTITAGVTQLTLDDVTNSHSFVIRGDNEIYDNDDGFGIWGGTTPRTLTVTSGNWTLDQDVSSGATPTFGADNFSDGGSNAIITTTQETNFEAAYTHVSNDGSDHSFIDQSVISGANVTFGTIASGRQTITGDATSCITANQGADDKGVEVYGYDDKSDDYAKLSVNQYGVGELNSSIGWTHRIAGSAKYIVTASAFHVYTGVSFQLGSNVTGFGRYQFTPELTGNDCDLKIYYDVKGGANTLRWHLDKDGNLAIGGNVDIGGTIRTTADQDWNLGAASAEADFAGDTKVRVTIGGSDYDIVALAVP